MLSASTPMIGKDVITSENLALMVALGTTLAAEHELLDTLLGTTWASDTWHLAILLKNQCRPWGTRRRPRTNREVGTRLAVACAEDEGGNANVANGSAEWFGGLFRTEAMLMSMDHLEKIVGLGRLANVVGNEKHLE